MIFIAGAAIGSSTTWYYTKKYYEKIAQEEIDDVKAKFSYKVPSEEPKEKKEDSQDQKTVAACDLLVPYVGELVGGSQREERYDVLEAKIQEMGISQETLQWYLDLRRFGGCKHSGFGLGFDRMLMYLSGIQNIRDVQPYPRTPRNLIF